MIIKYLFTPTRVEFTITSWDGEEFLVTTYLDKIDVLMDMPTEKLQSEVSAKEAQSKKVMKEFTQELSTEDISSMVETASQFQVNSDSSQAKAVAATSYWCKFTKEVYGELDLLMRFWVEMDWQVSSGKITYCAPTSGGQGYVYYTYTGASTHKPTVYTTYATLTNKTGYFRDSLTGGTVNVKMPTLTVYSDGTYYPTGTIY